MRSVHITRYKRVLISLMIVYTMTMTGCSGGGGSDGGNPYHSGEPAFSVSSTVPEDGAVDVPTETTIEITFSEDIEAGTATSSTILLSTGSTSIPGEVTGSGAAVLFAPSHSLSQGTRYTARITTGVKNTGGGALDSDYTWTFTTIGHISPPSESKWLTAVGGESHIVALKDDGTLWAWGCNALGQLGDGEGGDSTHDHDRLFPIQVGEGADWTSVTAGSLSTLAIRSNGTLWAWGHGMLGDGMASTKPFPAQIGSGYDWGGIDTGLVQSFSVAVKEEGALWAWGVNSSGQLGNGTGGDHTSDYDSLVPVQAGTETDWAATSAGKDHVLAIKEGGTLWAWGCNNHGQLGDGTGGDLTDDTPVNTPVPIEPDARWLAVSSGVQYSLAIMSDGTLWGWGYNWHGQIGDGTQISRNVPVQVGSDTDWMVVAAGWDHSAAIKKDGSLWTWGSNNAGQLGDGTTAERHAPGRVGTENTWAAVTAGRYYTVAVKEDGTLWSWGKNSCGQLGDGTTVERHLPVQIQ